MALSDIVIISSIITGLISIPFLVTGPLSDSVPTGKLVLDMEDETEVESIPSKMSKVFSSDRFEKTYETPFGKFTMRISAGEVFQELSKPGKVTVVKEDTEKTVWKIKTNEYRFKITRSLGYIEQICTTPNGELTKVLEKGEVAETFEGVNQEGVVEVCAEVEQELQEEVEKMEQIKSESEFPSTKKKGEESSKGVVINEFVSDPNTDEDEWIELYNKGSSEVNLTGWTIEDNTGSTYGSGGGNTTLDGLVISGKGYLVLDDVLGFGLNQNDDIIILKEGDEVVDQVAYGDFDDGDTSDNAPVPEDGRSAARTPDGIDTNSDTDDFEIDDTPTPGATNS